MFQKIEQNLQKVLSALMQKDDAIKVLRKGTAMRVIFFYPGEEGTYVDHPEVTLYENGIVQIYSNQEETTAHLQNCEILWRFEVDAEERTNKVRLLKPKVEKTAEKVTTEKVSEKNPDQVKEKIQNHILKSGGSLNQEMSGLTQNLQKSSELKSGLSIDSSNEPGTEKDTSSLSSEILG